MAAAFPPFNIIFDDLNVTLHELSVLREAVRNATSAIKQLQLKEEKAMETPVCTTQVGAENATSGLLCMKGDVLWCFLASALVFGVVVGLWMAGDEPKGKDGESSFGED